MHGFDPLYPLIVEIALVPARMARLWLASALLLVVSLAYLVFLESSVEGVTQIKLGESHKVLVISTPNGARWLPCPFSKTQTCLEVLPPKTNFVSSNP